MLSSRMKQRFSYKLKYTTSKQLELNKKHLKIKFNITQHLQKTYRWLQESYKNKTKNNNNTDERPKKGAVKLFCGSHKISF